MPLAQSTSKHLQNSVGPRPAESADKCLLHKSPVTAKEPSNQMGKSCLGSLLAGLCMSFRGELSSLSLLRCPHTQDPTTRLAADACRRMIRARLLRMQHPGLTAPAMHPHSAARAAFPGACSFSFWNHQPAGCSRAVKQHKRQVCLAQAQ